MTKFKKKQERIKIYFIAIKHLEMNQISSFNNQ